MQNGRSAIESCFEKDLLLKFWSKFASIILKRVTFFYFQICTMEYNRVLENMTIVNES